MRVKGFSLTLRSKAKSRFNPTGELKTVILRVSSGVRGARRPHKSLIIQITTPRLRGIGRPQLLKRQQNYFRVKSQNYYQIFLCE